MEGPAMLNKQWLKTRHVSGAKYFPACADRRYDCFLWATRCNHGREL